MKKFLIPGILVLFAACDQDEQYTNPPVDSNIVIEVRELLGQGERVITLFCKTSRIYECMNYPILADEIATENSYEVTFKGIGLGSLCVTATGPAIRTIDLRSLAAGEHTLKLNNGDLKNTGTLEITDTEINLVFSEQNGIEIVRQTTRRVPDKTYWGYIGYQSANSTSLVSDFIDNLTDLGAAFNKQVPGHYFHYVIDANGDLFVDVENSGYNFMRGFIFQYDGDESELEELMVDARRLNPELYIRIQTYQGEAFNN